MTRRITGVQRKGAAVTVRDGVREFIIRQSPEAVCDDCIAASLGFSVRQHANHKTLDLARMEGFDRRKDVCSVCGLGKKVIRYIKAEHSRMIAWLWSRTTNATRLHLGQSYEICIVPVLLPCNDRTGVQHGAAWIPVRSRVLERLL